jgi:hypothetical protein
MLQTEAITHLVEQLRWRGSGFFRLFQVIGHGKSYWTKWLILINSLSFTARLSDMSDNLLFRHVVDI